MYPITEFEKHKGIFTILLIFEEKKLNLTEIKKLTGKGVNAIRNSVEKLLQLELLELVPVEKLMERRVQLSEKGKKLIPLLMEINDILKK
ncbi:MAG: hypothetical protein HGN29_17165 [Asgard group archaeon]|nr:hypothetical protein [Asgard group archaeon]